VQITISLPESLLNPVAYGAWFVEDETVKARDSDTRHPEEKDQATAEGSESVGAKNVDKDRRE